MTEPIRFFLPGPTWVRESVRDALTHPAIGHRGPEFKQLYASLAPRLQQVVRTGGDVLTATGSATLVMESAVVSTVEKSVLNLTCGAFSERWHAICRSWGMDADRVSVPWGEAVDPDLVRSALRRRRYDVVTTVHNETSTGVINPLQEIARVVREESDSLILADCVSSLGGAPVETDAWGIDIVLAGVQKAMALPPALIVFTFSDRAAAQAERIPHRGFYLDLLRYRQKHRQGGTPTTPAIPVFFAMDRQLDLMLAEGMEARWERHRGLQRQTAAWVAANGFEFASAEAHRSPTVSCLRPAAGVDPRELVGSLAEAGIVVGGGYGEWKPSTFRIGHMGEVRSSDLEFLFGAVERSVGALAAT